MCMVLLYPVSVRGISLLWSFLNILSIGDYCLPN